MIPFENLQEEFRLINGQLTVSEYEIKDIDNWLLSFLMETPKLYGDTTTNNTFKWLNYTVAHILLYRICGGSESLYEILFKNSSAKMCTGKPCGKMFMKGDAVYRCSNHEGHDTSFHYTNGNGGYCDCGDPEAWKIPINCKYHTPGSEKMQDDIVLSQNQLLTIRKTLRTIVYMVYLTFSASPATSDFGRPYGSASAATYSTVLWNDESHSFNEVIDQVKKAIGCNTDTAQAIATTVDKVGRTVIASATSVSTLENIANIVRRIGLTVSIESTDHLFREEVANFLVGWLKAISSNCAQQAKGILQTSVTSTLLSKVEKSSDTFVHYFLEYDPKLWKEARNRLRALYIDMTVFGGDESKKKLALAFSDKYLTIAKNHLFVDREKDLSILTFSVQLYTVPSVAEYLIDCTPIVGNLLRIMKTIFVSDEEDMKAWSIDVMLEKADEMKEYYPKLSMENVKNISPFLHDLRLLLSAYKNRCATKYPLSDQDVPNQISDLKRVLDLLTLWQDMHPQVRLTTDHVEYESDNWIHAFNLAIQVERILSCVANSFFPNNSAYHAPRILNAASEARDCLLKWTLIDHIAQTGKMKSKLQVIGPLESEISEDGFNFLNFGKKMIRVPDYRISYQEVSFHKPVHWFFGKILSYFPRLLNEGISDEVSRQLVSFLNPDNTHFEGVLDSEHQSLSITERNMLIYDHTVRTFAFAAQIKADLWVRNGQSMRAQATHYRELALRSCSDVDLYLLQMAVVSLGADNFLAMMLSRFEVAYFFQVEPYFARCDSSQGLIVIQEFLQLLISLITERTVITAMSSSEKLKREIIHHLAISKSGLPFSELMKRVFNGSEAEDEHITDDDCSFEEILKSVANFKFPDGTTDHGLYQLKDQFYSQVYEWFYHFTRHQREDLEEVLKSKDKGEYQPRLSLIPIQPGIGLESISNIVHSSLFNQIIFFALWGQTRNLKDSGKDVKTNDLILSQTIHLVLLATEISKSNEDPFIKLSVSEEYEILVKGGQQVRPTNLLEIVLGLVDRANEENIKDHVKVLRYIISRFASIGGSRAESIIAGWRDKSNWTLVEAKIEIPDQEGLSKKDKQKMESKARRMAIMAQFAQAQQSFMASFGEDMENIDDTGDEPTAMDIDESPQEENSHERNAEFPSDICIVCQEVLDDGKGDELFGMLCFLQHSNIRKVLDHRDTHSLLYSLSSPLTLDVEIKLDYQKTWDQENVSEHNHMYGTHSKISGCHLSTCGHSMHVKCFDSYQKSIRARHQSQPTRNHPEALRYREFLCPLCKSLGNVLMPILWTHKKEKINWRGCDVTFDSINAFEVETYVDKYLTSFCTDSFESKYCGISKDTQDSEMNDKNGNDALVERLLNSIATPRSSIPLNSSDIYGAISMPGAYASQSEITIGHVRHMYAKYVTPNLRRIVLDNIKESTEINSDDLEQLYLIWETFYNTLCLDEIKTRGTSQIFAPSSGQSELASKLTRIGILDRLTVTNLTWLRILAETCTTALLIEGNVTEIKLKKVCGSFLNSVLANDVLATPLLMKDGFNHLVTASMSVFPCYNLYEESHIFTWIHLFAKFEVIRVAVSIIETWLLNDLDLDYGPVTGSLSKLFEMAGSLLGVDQKKLSMIISKCNYVHHVINSTLLIFCRRCVLLLYSRFGIVPPGGAVGFGYDLDKNPKEYLPDRNEEDELRRLLAFLGVPEPDQLVTSSCDFKLAKDWIIHLRKYSENHWNRLLANDPTEYETLILLEYPNIYDIIPMPKELESLLEVTLKRKCRNCKQVPADPAICLVCGELVCSQSFCCGKRDKGECNLHIARCGGYVGMYFIVKKCAVLLLSENLGYFLNPPYLDIHGEVDLGLKRGKPQFLNEKRYQVLKKLWLGHAIPSYVARKIEQTFDLGGWSTL